MTSTREVNQLLERVDKDWLAKRLEERKLHSSIIGKKIVDKSLLQYVEAIINGEKPKPPAYKRHYNRRCSKVNVYDRTGKLVRIEYANGNTWRTL